MQLRAEAGEHRVVALAGKGWIGAPARIFHRPADDDPSRSLRQPSAGMRDQPIEEDPAELLEPEALAEYRGGIEAGARRDRLERLDEPARLRILQIFGDCPRPRRGGEAAAHGIVVPEAQSRAKQLASPLRPVEVEEVGPVRPPDAQDGVGGAEVEADRLAAHCHRGLRTGGLLCRAAPGSTTPQARATALALPGFDPARAKR